MADRRRAELAGTVTDTCEGLAECGFLGILETNILKTFTELHKYNDAARISTLIAALEVVCTRMVASRTPPTFPQLVVAAQLLLDVEGPAAPPEGADSPLDAEFRSLAANLRLALCAGLLTFARPGSEDAQQGLDIAMGMLIMLHDKLDGEQLTCLAVEHAMLRLLCRSKGCVMLLRGRTWALGPLNQQVAALRGYTPNNGTAGEDDGVITGDEDEAELDEEDGEDEEEDEQDEQEAGGEAGADGDEEGGEEVVEEETYAGQEQEDD